jgi:ribose transport system permease protein
VVYKVPIPIAMLVALAIGVVCGLLNGLVIAFARIPPFIATFAMMYITRGLAYYFMHSSSIQGFDARFRFIGTGSILGVPMPILWAALLYLIFHVMLENTPFGVTIRSVGANPESSRLAGLNLNRTTVVVYGLNGLLAAFAGLIYTARLNNAEAVIGGSFPLDTIAAVIIGGTSLFGGEGHLAGTLVGVLILTVILNGMNLMGIPSIWQSLITGLVILIMIAAQTYTKKIGLRRLFARR